MNRRRPAFDPSRLDDIDDLLPPAPLVPPTPLITPAPPRKPEPAPPVPDHPAEQHRDHERPAQRGSGGADPATAPRPAPARMSRGQGGRPARPPRTSAPAAAESGDPGRVPVAVRIPRALYDDINTQLLAGPERPSYGQLVLWTCEDHPDEVAAEVRAARPGADSRRPRGRRLAADTVQVTLRLTLAERGLLDDIADTVRATHPGLVTRTEVATGALRYALEAPPTT